MSEIEALLLMLISIGAFCIPLISRRLMMPTSVGEILYGVILAFFFAKYQEPFVMVDYFSQFGFLLLMYLAGLELDFERFRTLSRRDLWLFFFVYVPLISASIFITTYFSLNWVFALIFFTTGIGLLFPVLKETGLNKNDFGQNILVIAMIGEVLTLIGLTIVTMANNYGFTLASVLHISSIAGFFLVIYIIMRIFKVTLWWHPNMQSLFLTVGDPTETGIRANFVILFTFVAFAAAIQIELVVGAFIGGMMFSLVFANKEEVREKLDGIGYGFFVPVFFISVGLSLSFADFMQMKVLVMSLGITAAVLATRIVGSLPLYFSSIKKKKLLLIPFALSFPITMMVAVASICYKAGLITKQESSAVILAAVISAIVYPWVFKVGTNILIPEE